MTELKIINGNKRPEPPPFHKECVALADGVFDLCSQGKVRSIAVVMITAPGVYRIAAAGDDLDGMLAGAKEMQVKLQEALTPKPPEPKKTVIHR